MAGRTQRSLTTSGPAVRSFGPEWFRWPSSSSVVGDGHWAARHEPVIA